jgi:hypothetical protein
MMQMMNSKIIWEDKWMSVLLTALKNTAGSGSGRKGLNIYMDLIFQDCKAPKMEHIPIPFLKRLWRTTNVGEHSI